MNEQHQKHYAALEHITPYLQSLRIDRDDIVLSIPDPSFNISLYLIDRKGFTSGGGNSNGFKMERMFRNGLQYMIINDARMMKDTVIRKFLDYPMGRYRNVSNYDLRPYRKDFTD